jgi:hypothetical protein
MTKLEERSIGDVKLRNFADTTIQTYIRVVEDFARRLVSTVVPGTLHGKPGWERS